WGPSNWNIIPADVRAEIMQRLFGPGHFTEMRLFGNPDASELLEAKQAGMTNAVPIMDPCDDTGDAVAGVAADYRNTGVPVKAVSIANKPNNDNQMHCSKLPASTIADDVASLRQALNEHGLSDVLVLAPDTVEWSPISVEELNRCTFDPGSTIEYLQAIA